MDELRYDSLSNQWPGNLADLESGAFDSPDWGALHVVRSTKEGVYTPFAFGNINENIDTLLQP